MIALAEMFAECAIRDNLGALALFNEELNKARADITKLGHKGMRREVEFVGSQSTPIQNPMQMPMQC